MAHDGRILTRPFVVGFALSLLAYFAIGTTIPLLPRLVTHGLGGDRADVGRLAAVFSVAAVLGRPLLSWLARRGVRAMAVSGSLLMLIGAVLMVRVGGLVVLAASRTLYAIGEALVWTACGTLCSALAGPARQAEAVSLMSVAVFLGIGTGPIATEPLVRAGRFDAAAGVGVGVCAVALALAVLVRNDWIPAGRVRRGRLTRRELFHPAALLPGTALALVIIGWSAWSNFVALRADEVGLRNAAGLFTVYGGVSLLIRLLGARLPATIGLRRSAAVAALLVALGLLVFGWAGSAGALYLGAVVLSCGIGLTFPALSALALTGLADESERAGLLSTFGMFFELGAGVGGLLLGPVARSWGLSRAFRVGAAAPLGGIALLWWMRVRHRRS